MAGERRKKECFEQAEEELLSVISAMDKYKKGQKLKMLLEDPIDNEVISYTVANLQANTKKLEMMYSALFMLSKTYNKQFSSYLCRDRIKEVMKSFEDLKNTVEDLNEALPEMQRIPFNLVTNENTNKDYSHEMILNINEPECHFPEPNIFEGIFFRKVEYLDRYSKEQIVSGLLSVFCNFYKAVLAIMMMCKTIIQEEQDSLNSQDRLENIYQKSLQEVWDSLKDLTTSFNKEDYKEEMAEAKRFAMDRSLLQENFHLWSPEHFKRHAVAVQLYAQQLEKKKCNTLLLFPDNPEKEQDAIKIAENLDNIIAKTKKSKDGRSFRTRRLMMLMEAIGYKGSISIFLQFLGEHYAGKNGFPGISSFSKNSKEMIELEANKNTAEGREKWEKCQEEAGGVQSRVKILLNKTNSVSLNEQLQNRATAS